RLEVVPPPQPRSGRARAAGRDGGALPGDLRGGALRLAGRRARRQAGGAGGARGPAPGAVGDPLRAAAVSRSDARGAVSALGSRPLRAGRAWSAMPDGPPSRRRVRRELVLTRGGR